MVLNAAGSEGPPCSSHRLLLSSGSSLDLLGVETEVLATGGSVHVDPLGVAVELSAADLEMGFDVEGTP